MGGVDGLRLQRPGDLYELGLSVSGEALRQGPQVQLRRHVEDAMN
jgi:hypothetical protein